MTTAGRGFLLPKNPFSRAGGGFLFSSTTSLFIPAIETVPEPAFNGTRPRRGLGEIIIPPVSVCHQVSTMGQRLCPITLEYHCQAAGLIGSPTDPSRRKLLRS